MSEQQHHEKEEKPRQMQEKDEKHKEKEEKNWEEKWRRDPLSGIVWASALIWAGLVLLVDNLGLLTRFKPLDAWAIIFIGAGLIVLLGVAVRLLVPAYRRAVTGSLILGLILIGVGLGNLLSWNVIWPLILIALGVFVLVRGLIWRR
jgi:cation transport ATPase